MNNQNDCRLPTIFIYLKKNCYLLSDRELRLSLSLSEELLLDELPADDLQSEGVGYAVSPEQREQKARDTCIAFQ